MDYEDVVRYINDHWVDLIQNDPPVPLDNGTLIGLPRPYLIPSRREFAEMYYWDSYFMTLGVLGTRHEHLVVDIAENFAHLVERFGFIPNATRYYFTSRSQPPFYTRMFRLAYDVKAARGDNDLREFLERHRRLAALEHSTAWLGQDHRHERLVYRGLSRYRDVNANHFNASCESGWDHSTRCDGREADHDCGRWQDFIPVCLNAILYAREKDLQWAAETVGDASEAEQWEDKADARAATMHELMWNEEFKFYYDFDFASKDPTKGQKIDKYETLAGFLPMWAGLATKPQAQAMVRYWLPKFLYPGGLVTSLPNTNYPTGLSTRQWSFPNGWAPLQWLVVQGLERYGFKHEAMVVRRWWCDNCALVFRSGIAGEATGRGTLLEKYNVVAPGQPPAAGLYGTGVGFGWSNAIFVDFAKTLAAG